MPIPVTCPRCGRRAKAPDATAGAKVACPHCHAAIPVGLPEAEPEPEAAAAAKGRPSSSTLAIAVILCGVALLSFCCGGVTTFLGMKFLAGHGEQVEQAKNEQLEQAKKKTAKIVANELTKACETYCIDHGQYPQALDQLLRRDNIGGPYLKTPEALRDPWGNPYRYNAAGPRNGGTQPDVWAETPDGPIGNWLSALP
jgi:general secretion pathway protein G